MAVLNKVVQRNYRRTQDGVITAEHPKDLMAHLAWFGNTVSEIDV